MLNFCTRSVSPCRPVNERCVFFAGNVEFRKARNYFKKRRKKATKYLVEKKKKRKHRSVQNGLKGAHRTHVQNSGSIAQKRRELPALKNKYGSLTLNQPVHLAQN